MGLAVGDDQTGVVSPLEVVSYGGTTAGAQIIAETMIRVGAARAIIGLPALADGSLGPAARRTELLADAVRSLGIEVEVQPDTRVDYVEVRDAETLATVERVPDRAVLAMAVFLGKARLIDNTVLGGERRP